MPLESIQLGVLTSAPFLAATWDRLFTPPLEALEVAIAIRVNVAVPLACIAPTVASIPAKRLKAGIICGNGGITPSPLCTPEHDKHKNTPLLIDTHLGLEVSNVK